MGPELAFALLGYPLGILTSFTYDQLQNLARDLNTELEPLRGIFLKAFRKSLQVCKKRGDAHAKKVIKAIENRLKKEREALWRVLVVAVGEEQEVFAEMRSPEFRRRLAGVCSDP